MEVGAPCARQHNARRDPTGTDVDDDGGNEILVGTAKKGDEKARVIIYNGDSRAQEWSRERK